MLRSSCVVTATASAADRGSRSARPDRVQNEATDSKKILNGFGIAAISAFTMIKTTTTALIATAMLLASSAFAGDKACCPKGAADPSSMACVDLATLNLTPDQKAKIEAWQADCMKAGCTKESRKTFLKQAKGILSAEQFAQLKAQCKKTTSAKKTEA
jgi:hypothetical protein